LQIKNSRRWCLRKLDTLREENKKFQNKKRSSQSDRADSYTFRYLSAVHTANAHANTGLGADEGTLPLGPATLLLGAAVVRDTCCRAGHGPRGKRRLAHRRHVRGDGRPLLLHYLAPHDDAVHRLTRTKGPVGCRYQLREDWTGPPAPGQ
jgi:hypothetical protein